MCGQNTGFRSDATRKFSKISSRAGASDVNSFRREEVQIGDQIGDECFGNWHTCQVCVIIA